MSRPDERQIELLITGRPAQHDPLIYPATVQINVFGQDVQIGFFLSPDQAEELLAALQVEIARARGRAAVSGTDGTLTRRPPPPNHPPPPPPGARIPRGNR